MHAGCRLSWMIAVGLPHTNLRQGGRLGLLLLQLPRQLLRRKNRRLPLPAGLHRLGRKHRLQRAIPQHGKAAPQAEQQQGLAAGVVGQLKHGLVEAQAVHLLEVVEEAVAPAGGRAI